MRETTRRLLTWTVGGLLAGVIVAGRLLEVEAPFGAVLLGAAAPPLLGYMGGGLVDET